jgi:protein-disulfide isomerase
VLLGAVGAAAVLAIVLIAVTSDGNERPGNVEDHRVAAVPEMRAMLAGIPQRGLVLGDPKAKVTVVEYVDPQCPICKQFANDVFPTLVQDDVRTGKVRYEYRTLHFLDARYPGITDSQRGAQLLNAAGFQDRMFDLAALLYANQGREGSGFLTPAYERGLAAAVPGLDVARLERDASGARAKALVTAADEQAVRDRVEGTPTLLVGPTGGTLTPVDAGRQALEVGPYAGAIDAALTGQR